jgi:hypothetical protein
MVSLNHTHPIPLHYNTHEVFQSHLKSSQVDFLFLFYDKLSHQPTTSLHSQLNCLGILLTYIAEGRTLTNSKHISPDPYQLLPPDMWKTQLALLLCGDWLLPRCVYRSAT